MHGPDYRINFDPLALSDDLRGMKTSLSLTKQIIKDSFR